MSSIENENPPSATIAVETTAAAPSRPRFLALALGAAVLAGLAAWWAGEAAYGRFQPKLLAPGGIPTAAEAAASAAGHRAGVVTEATVARGLLGALLGLALGAAGGISRRSPRATVKAAGLGLALGAAAALIAVRVIVPLTFRLQPTDGDDLVPAILLQGLIAAAIGTATGLGLAAGSGLGPAWRGVVGGAAGGVLGLVLYQVAGALAFPMDSTSDPVATTSPARLAYHLLVALGVAALAALALVDRPRNARAAGPA